MSFGASFYFRFSDAGFVNTITSFRVNDFAFWASAVFLTLIIFARSRLISK